MNVLGTVLDINSLRIIGLITVEDIMGPKGPMKSFSAYTIQQLSQGNFENRQLKVQNGRIITKKGTELNKLRTFFPLREGMKASTIPQTVLPEYFIEVPNKLVLTERVLVNGVLRGFTVNFGEGYVMGRINYDSAVALRNWLDATNYVVRTTSGGKKYLAGKGGTIIENLPEVEIGNKVQTSRKKRVSTGGSQTATSEIVYNRSLLELIEEVASAGGVIIRLPGQKYNRILDAETKVGSDFIPLGIGEVAVPKIVYSETTFNANILFKKIGTVNVNGMPIYTFVYESKSIFVDGAVNMLRFGVGVPKEAAEKIISNFGKDLIVEQIKDSRKIKPIEAVTGLSGKDMVYFVVDTTKLEIMSENSAKDNLRETETICRDALELAALKIHAKVMRDCIKKTKEVLSKTNPDALKKIGRKTKTVPMFAGYNAEMLEAIENVGIDITSGAYTKREAFASKEEKDSMKAEAYRETPVSIEYQVVGASSQMSKINYSSVLAGLSDESKMPKGVGNKLADIVSKLSKLTDTTRYQEATTLLETIEKRQEQLRKHMWLHKMAGAKLGEKEKVLDFRDGDSWEEVKTKAKEGKMYKCTLPGYGSVKLSVKGIDIKK